MELISDQTFSWSEILRRLDVSTDALVAPLIEAVLTSRPDPVTGSYLVYIVTAIWVEDTKSRTGETFKGYVIAAYQDGDVSATLIAPDVVPFVHHTTSFAACDNGIVVHTRDTHEDTDAVAIYCPYENGKWGDHQKLTITRPLPVSVAKQGFHVPVLPGLVGFGDGNCIAFNLFTTRGDETTRAGHVGFMIFDIAAKTLAWRTWLQDTVAKPQGLMARLFGSGNTADKTPLTPNDFLRLKAAEFPRLPEHGEDRIGVSQAAYVDGQVMIHTAGNAPSKYGNSSFTVATIDKEGHVIDRRYHMDFLNHPLASKKHQVNAQFVDGGRRAVLKSQYATTDIWKKRTALLDCMTGEVTVMMAPKALTELDCVGVVNNHAIFAQSDENAMNFRVAVTAL